VNARVVALAVAVLAIGLVVAQIVAPATPLYHTWQYALALTLALTVLGAYANGARKGEDGVAGKRLLVTIGGAAIVALAGLASGLLGPDTATVIGTPGTVRPVPALGVAAFFSAADAGAVSRGDANVTLRRRDGAAIALERGRRKLLGESLVYLDAQPAAAVAAYDARGAHLTVTQPNATSFLSPVLLFREQQRIGDLHVPFDTFATPAQHRVFRALYFTPDQLRAFRHAAIDAKEPALVVTASDDRGQPLGITLVASGSDATLAGVRLRVTLGTYPALAIAAAPEPWALVAGLLLFAFGLMWSASALRSPQTAARTESSVVTGSEPTA
jgi:hypothetical protein